MRKRVILANKINFVEKECWNCEHYHKKGALTLAFRVSDFMTFPLVYFLAKSNVEEVLN